MLLLHSPGRVVQVPERLHQGIASAADRFQARQHSEVVVTANLHFVVQTEFFFLEMESTHGR
ncbi:MAG: hypothetical protein ACKOOC_04015, partial [Cyanobium sp.]